MSEQETKPAEPKGEAQSNPSQSPAIGTGSWLVKAGEWLQRPPTKRMGLITTAIVLLIMFLLVLLGN